MPTITVSDSTALIFTATDGDLDIYSETYFGHETGNTVKVPFSATPADVIEQYLSV